MIIGRNNSLGFFTHIKNAEGKDMAFKWIDPIKRTGYQIEIEWNAYGAGRELMRSDGSIAGIEWTEEKPFPYDIIIEDPITRIKHINPCEHELVTIQKNGDLFREGCRIERELEKKLMAKSARLDEQWQELNR
jgi:hypothetical protein